MQNQNICVGGVLTITDVARVSFESKPIKITFDSTSWDRAQESYTFVQNAPKDSIFYGINTGFGPMAQTYIQPAEQTKLQYNLIRSHACGLGDALPTYHVRAIMLTRLHTLARGYSGVQPAVLKTLAALIEHNITPVIPEHGSVGASGDLVQLAHIALAVIGEGEVIYDGVTRPAREVLEEQGVLIPSLSGRDGLALINGTSAMTGIAACTLFEAEQLVELSLVSTATLYELFEAYDEHYHPSVQALRPHTGQTHAINRLTEILKDSKRVRHTKPTQPPASAEKTTDLNGLPQEIYSLRCVPQVIGPIYDTIQSAMTIVETELNSITDNPLIDEGHAVHNGNFHGDYVALEMDKVRITLAKLSILIERQINFLVNPKQNEIFPPFANNGTPGLDLALQAAQFVATSTTAENQTLATPMYTHSITTNNDNQDVVSMGTNSAELTAKSLENTQQVLAVLLATLGQLSHQTEENNFSSITRTFLDNINAQFPKMETDRYFQSELAALVQLITQKCREEKTA